MIGVEVVRSDFMLKQDSLVLPPVVILGLSVTSLGVIRSFGRKGIRVIGIDHKKDRIGSYSKYCEALKCPRAGEAEDDLLDFMEGVARKIQDNAVLIPTNDEFVLFLSRNRNKLSRYYKFLLASEELIEGLNNKSELKRIAEKQGVQFPETVCPKNIEEVFRISDQIQYPCVVKPVYGHLYNNLQFKGILVNTPYGLIEIYKKYHNYLEKLVIQDFISGEDSAQFSFATYFNAESEPLATFTSRKIRQNPPVFGVGTFVAVCHEPKIEQIGISFLRKIKYKGIAEIEFKKDSKNGCFKMIEVNTRIWTQNNLATRCGVDLPYIAYNDILGRPFSGNSKRGQNIKWINCYDDFFGCFGASGYFKRGEITPTRWLKSLFSKKEHAVFAMDDLKPFMKSTDAFLFRVAKSIRNKIKFIG